MWKSALFNLAAILFCVGAVARFVWDRIPRCENCRTMRGLKHEASRTMYPWNGEGEDPNAPILLCSRCAVMHHDYWDDMWDEYNRGRL